MSAVLTEEALNADGSRIHQASLSNGNPFYPYEEVEELYQHIDDTITAEGMNTAVAFFIATAAMEYAQRNQGVFLSFLKGEITPTELQEALNPSQGGCPTCGQF